MNGSKLETRDSLESRRIALLSQLQTTIAGTSASVAMEGRKRKRSPSLNLNILGGSSEVVKQAGPGMTTQQLAGLEQSFVHGVSNEGGEIAVFKRSFIEDPWALLR